MTSNGKILAFPESNFEKKTSDLSK